MPAFFHNRLLMLVLMLGMGLGMASSVCAETKPASFEAVEKLQDRVIELEKETAVLKAELGTRIDAQDNRIADGIGLHGARVTELSNQTTQLGNYISYTSLALVLIGLVAGFLAFKRAEEIAKEQSEQWFRANDAKLREDFDKLVKSLSDYAVLLENNMKTVFKEKLNNFNEMESQYKRLIDESYISGGGNVTPVPIVEQAPAKSNTAMWTVDDWFAESEVLYSRHDFQGAIKAWNMILQMRESMDFLEDSGDKHVFLKSELRKIQTELLLRQLGAISIDRSIRQEALKLNSSRENVEGLAKLLSEEARVMKDLGLYDDAIKNYDLMIQLLGGEDGSKNSSGVLSALYKKITILEKKGLISKTIEAADELISRFANKFGDTEGVEQNLVVSAFMIKAMNYKKLGEISDAIQAYDELIERFGRYESPHIKEILNFAKNHRHSLLTKVERE